MRLFNLPHPEKTLVDNILIKYSKKWHLVDMQDSFVVFTGTYQECDQLIPTLSGGLYVILRKRDLNEQERSSLDILRNLRK